MENREIIEYVNTGNLIPFKNHPFKLKDGEEKEQLLESVKAQGTIEPLIVRPSSPAGKYEIVSGHRRMEACKELGIANIPVIVRNLTDEQAAVMMADANLHRENILPSEKAFAYKMKLDALNHQGVACGQVGHKSRDGVSDTESGRTVQRYIRLTYLIPELLDKMDEGKMALSVGVDLSYLESGRKGWFWSNAKETTAHRPIRRRSDFTRQTVRECSLKPSSRAFFLKKKPTSGKTLKFLLKNCADSYQMQIRSSLRISFSKPASITENS